MLLKTNERTNIVTKLQTQVTKKNTLPDVISASLQQQTTTNRQNKQTNKQTNNNKGLVHNYSWFKNIMTPVNKWR